MFSIYESDGSAICDSESDEAPVEVKLFVVLEQSEVKVVGRLQRLD